MGFFFHKIKNKTGKNLIFFCLLLPNFFLFPLCKKKTKITKQSITQQYNSFFFVYFMVCQKKGKSKCMITYCCFKLPVYYTKKEVKGTNTWQRDKVINYIIFLANVTQPKIWLISLTFLVKAKTTLGRHHCIHPYLQSLFFFPPFQWSLTF